MDLSSQLIEAFREHPLGLCGQHDPALAASSVENLEQRLGILALGSVLDINPLPKERLEKLVKLENHWLLDPGQVAYQSSQQVGNAMQQAQILGPGHIPRVWWQISRGVQGRFNGSWRQLIRASQDNAQELGNYLQKSRATFPVLAGPVISVRWLDLVHRIGGVTLEGWEELRVPLPTKLKKTAKAFDLGEEVHPLLFSALHLWAAACQQLPEESCGFKNCPKK
jgi:hypothetical protein